MRTEFPQKIADSNETKIFYNRDNNIGTLLEWYREPIKNLKNKIEYLALKSGIIPVSDECKKCCLIENSFGSLISCCNNIYQSTMFVFLMTCPNTQKNGSALDNTSILPQNFLKCVSAFTARKAIDSTWINQKDEYMAPNEQHPKFQQFQNDSIIYSLFNSSSQQTSLRNIQYHNKTWNIRNNFFWCSNSWIKALAELYNNEQVYNDLIQYPTDPYVYTLIGQKITNREPFGRTALQVLDKASHLLETTFQYRNEFNNEHPEYQVCNWDCGYYQLKPMWKKYKEKEFKEFRELYLTFRDELKPLVYELGFLKE